jgi:hypothetical protein
MALAALALVFAMVGTALAGPDAVSRALTKSKVKAIAKKEINKAAPGLTVAKAVNADNATNATNATTAANATNAASANDSDAVEGNVVRKINLLAAPPVAAGTPLLDLAGLQLTATCAAGLETVVAHSTVAEGEISSISTDASNDSVENVQDDVFGPGDDVNLTNAASSSDRVYNINYSGGDGRNVVVQLVTEDGLGTSTCRYTGMAIGG